MGGGAPACCWGARSTGPSTSARRIGRCTWWPSLEGVWLGAWLPYALWERDQVTARQVAGGMTAGMMGGLALARLASPLVQADSQTAAGRGHGQRASGRRWRAARR